MSKLVGGVMISAPSLGLFAYAANRFGWVEAVIGFGLIILFAAWIVVASMLLEGD